ncbi:uncharacterized protein ASCRUDRAFT_155082 [Ascoidea rubescens DSM 1968]|uniref:Uncharacterized protein n=1 Tax=Ascoidea rubescens DSM 1968 TaxID=1344418 RepID=A0A1D2VG39_9ASCO|nr:hypothetical protein ASCRUDRAFT_155082 [Ascoidea rubescens DSM 1968]ODV60559.1 hypothetical protein ASCRUDRAFT_155082 [Ascoidea rubescens DSM 1968]
MNRKRSCFCMVVFSRLQKCFKRVGCKLAFKSDTVNCFIRYLFNIYTLIYQPAVCDDRVASKSSCSNLEEHATIARRQRTSSAATPVFGSTISANRRLRVGVSCPVDYYLTILEDFLL